MSLYGSGVLESDEPWWAGMSNTFGNEPLPFDPSPEGPPTPAPPPPDYSGYGASYGDEPVAASSPGMGITSPVLGPSVFDQFTQGGYTDAGVQAEASIFDRFTQGFGEPEETRFDDVSPVRLWNDGLAPTTGQTVSDRFERTWTPGDFMGLGPQIANLAGTDGRGGLADFVPAEVQKAQAVQKLREQGFDNFANVVAGSRINPVNGRGGTGGFAWGPESLNVGEYQTDDFPGQTATHEGLHGADKYLGQNLDPATLKAVRAQLRAFIDERAAAGDQKAIYLQQEDDTNPYGDGFALGHMLTYALGNDGNPAAPPELLDTLRNLDTSIADRFSLGGAFDADVNAADVPQEPLSPEQQEAAINFFGQMRGLMGNIQAEGARRQQEEFAKVEDVLGPDWQNRQSTLGRLAGLYNTDIPGYSDFARNVLRPGAQFLGDMAESQPGVAQGFGIARRGLDAIGGPNLPDTGDLYSAFTPVTAGDVALTAIPAATQVGKGLRAGLPVAESLKRGALTAAETLLPTENLNHSLDNIGQAFRGGETGAARIPGGGDELADEVSTFVRYRYTNPGPAGPYIGSMTVKGPASRGDVIKAMFGDAEVTSATKQGATVDARRLPDLQTEALEMGIEPIANGKPLSRQQLIRKIDQARASAASPSPAPIEGLADFERSLKKLADAKKQGPEAFAAERARQADVVNQRLAQQQATDAANARLRYSNTGRQSVEDSRSQMEKAFDEVRQGAESGSIARHVSDAVEHLAKAGEEGMIKPDAFGDAVKRATSGVIEEPLQLRLPGNDWKPTSPLKSRVIDNLLDAWNLPRSLLSTLDFSYPLRQGLLMARHGEEFAKAFATGARTFLDDDLARTTMAQIESVPRANLHISPLTGGKLLNREEQFLSRMVEKIPLARRSQQASIVFINKLRADVFDTVTKAWIRNGHTPTANDLEGLGNYINRATGFGTLGDFENAAGVLAQGFFSPRLLAARIQAPGYLWHSSPKVRQEAMKDFLAVFGATSALLGLAQYSGAATVELDPRSSDFGKAKIGNTRIDPWGGYQQLARYTAQLMSGQYKSQTGFVGDANRAETALRFIRSKLSPSTGLAVNLATGKDMIGEEVTPSKPLDILKNTAVPIFWQDMIEAINEDNATGVAMMIPAFFGVGVQQYGPSAAMKRTPELNSAIDLYFDASDEAFDRIKEKSTDSPYSPLLRESKSYDEFRKDLREILVIANQLKPELNVDSEFTKINTSLGFYDEKNEVLKAAIRRSPDLLAWIEESGEYDAPKWMYEYVKELEGAPK